MFTFVGGHAALVAGLSLVAAGEVAAIWGSVTVASQWAAVQMALGTGAGEFLTALGGAANLASTIALITQAHTGDPIALSIVACPAAFGMGSLWNDFAAASTIGSRTSPGSRASRDIPLGQQDIGSYFPEHQKGLYNTSNHIYGQNYRDSCALVGCKMMLADKGILTTEEALAQVIKGEKGGARLSNAVKGLNSALSGTGIKYKYDDAGSFILL